MARGSSTKKGLAPTQARRRAIDEPAEPLPDEPEEFWPAWENTSDEDLERDTYGPARQRELARVAQ
jgi:hypothetical protein